MTLVLDFERKCAKYRKRAIEEGIEFAFKTLMPRVKNPVYINIRPIRDLAAKAGVHGDVMDEGDREFTIRIDVSLSLDEMVSTILHEMVHVQQYLSGRLKQPYPGTAVFERVDYDWDMSYDARPWEIEAHAKEKQLKEAFDSQRGKSLSIWSLR